MGDLGMRKGEKYEILVVKEEHILGSIEHAVVANDAVKTSVFVEDRDNLVSIYEALSAAHSAVHYHIHSNDLRQMLQERIDELEGISKGVEGEPPYPDDIIDIPF